MRLVLCIVGVTAGVAPAVCGQLLKPTSIRLEAGSLGPDDPFNVTLAVGAILGWQVSPHGSVLVRYLRQGNYGTDVASGARSFLTVNWEHAFGESRHYRRQLLVRLGAGPLFRSPFKMAAVADAGIELRYALTGHWGLIASAEDDAAALPGETVSFCSASSCTVYRIGGTLQHNFGLMIAGEWRR